MKPRLAITYDGKNQQGFHVFTCMINGSLRTYRAMGYTKRHATQAARAYFKREQEAA